MADRQLDPERQPGATPIAQKEAVLSYIISLLEEITADEEGAPIVPTTLLKDIFADSINFVYFLADIQQHFHLQNLLLKAVSTTGSAVVDFCVADVADLVCALLNAPDDRTSGG